MIYIAVRLAIFAIAALIMFLVNNKEKNQQKHRYRRVCCFGDSKRGKRLFRG